MENASFNLSSFVFSQMYFEIVQPVSEYINTHPENGNSECLIGMNGKVILENEKTVSSILSVTLDFKNDREDLIAKLRIQCHGIFTSNGAFTKEYVERMQASFHAILYPFVRETIYTLTNKSGIQIILNPVNFVASVQNDDQAFSFESAI